MQNYFNAKDLKMNGFSQRFILSNDIYVNVRKCSDNLIHIMREDNQATESGTASKVRRTLETWERENVNPKPQTDRPSGMIGFARVSTTAQDLTVQIKALETQKCFKIFKWKHSGKEASNKAAIDELINFVQDGDVVVVTKIDRLGRSLRHIINTVDALSAKGVAFKSLDGRIDTSGTDKGLNTLVIAIFGSLAQIERDLIVGRCLEGKLESGNFGGRLNKLTLEQRNNVRAQLDQGIDRKLIRTEFNISVSTLARIKRSTD